MVDLFNIDGLPPIQKETNPPYKRELSKQKRASGQLDPSADTQLNDRKGKKPNPNETIGRLEKGCGKASVGSGATDYSR